MRWNEDVDRRSDAAARQVVQRSRGRPGQPGIGPREEQGRHQALLLGWETGIKQQDSRKDHSPPSADGPTDLGSGHPAVKELPASGKTQLAVHQLGGRSRQHRPSVEDTFPVLESNLEAVDVGDPSATPCG